MSDDDSEQSERDTLEARARLLARPRGERTKRVETYAVFERSNVRYAIEPRYVFAVARAREPTPLPGTDPHWAGVSSVHGELLALVDLPALLGNGPAHDAPTEIADQSTHQGRLVLVLGTTRREFGILIDAVLDATSLAVEIARTPAGDSCSQLIVGTTADGTRIVRGDALLSDRRLFIEALNPHES